MTDGVGSTESKKEGCVEKMSSVEVRRRFGHRSELNAEHEISGETLLHLFTYFSEKPQRKSTWLLFFYSFSSNWSVIIFGWFSPEHSVIHLFSPWRAVEGCGPLRRIWLGMVLQRARCVAWPA